MCIRMYICLCNIYIYTYVYILISDHVSQLGLIPTGKTTAIRCVGFRERLASLSIMEAELRASPVHHSTLWY